MGSLRTSRLIDQMDSVASTKKLLSLLTESSTHIPSQRCIDTVESTEFANKRRRDSKNLSKLKRATYKIRQLSLTLSNFSDFVTHFQVSLYYSSHTLAYNSIHCPHCGHTTAWDSIPLTIAYRLHRCSKGENFSQRKQIIEFH